jgi:hypothetical protein
MKACGRIASVLGSLFVFLVGTGSSGCSNSKTGTGGNGAATDASDVHTPSTSSGEGEALVATLAMGE